MSRVFNPYTGQFEDSNARKQVGNSTSGKRRVFNPVTGQFEEEELFNSTMTPQSVTGGIKPKFNLGTIPQTGIPLGKETDYSLLDVLGAGQYTSAKFVDTLLDTGNPVQAFALALEEGKKAIGSTVNRITGGPNQTGEEIIPERLSYSDIIKKQSPEFAKNYPISTSVLGFVGDVALDPTTYLSFGTATAARTAGKKLSNQGIDVVRNLHSLSNDGFKVTVKNKEGLERVAYFGIDEINKLKETKDIITISQDALAGDKAALGKLNFIVNSQTKGFKGKISSIDELSSAEKTWSVENNFLSMARDNPKLVLEGGDLGVFFNIPFSPKRITVVKPAQVDAIFDKLGLSKLSKAADDALKESDFAFGRDFPVPDEYLQLRNNLYGRMNVVDHSLLTSVRDFSVLPKESKQKLADLAIRIDQRILDKKAVLPAGETLSDKSINATRQFHLNKELTDQKINVEEFNTFSKFIESHNRLAQSALEGNLFKQASGLFFDRDVLGKNVFDVISKKGSKDLDLAVLQALKIKALGYKQAFKDFDDGLKLLYGTEKDGKLISFTPPKAVQKDIDFIGESIHSQKVNRIKVPGFEALGKFNNVFKLLAYPIRPFAAVKQFPGNTLQAFSQIGATAFRNFDPRSVIDAALIIGDNSSFSKLIPSYIIEGMAKFATPTGKIIHAVDQFQPKLLDGKMVGRLGETVPYEQLANEVMEKDIYHKGLDILSLEQDRNLKLQIAKANGFIAFQKEKWQEGFWTFVKESIPWINLPSHIENMNRVSTYVNARRLGMDADNAARTTKKALFDYQHGLTEFETAFMRRIVPFYTFQRFAVPLIASLVKEPGKAITLNKMTKEFFEVYEQVASDQQLSDEQRKVLPGYLIEQPNAFEGFTQDGQTKKGVFRTFNSYVYTDWLSLIQTDKEGNIDFKRTVEKMTFAQITPILKVPLELLAERQFFNDRPLATPGFKARGDKISSGEAVNFYDKYLPDIVKKYTSYEVRVNPQTGEKEGYINPYLTYLSKSFAPFISDYINIGKYDMNPRETTIRLLTGTGKVKLDFQKEQHFRIKEWDERVKELQLEMRFHQQGTEAFNEDQKKLQVLLAKKFQIQQLNVK